MLSKELLDFKNKLLNEMFLGSGIKGLVEKISALISKPILITNSTSLVIAYASVGEDSPGEKYIKIIASNPLSRLGLINWNGMDRQSLIYDLTNNKSILGYLIILDAGIEDDDIILKGEQALNICTLEMIQQQRLMYTEKGYKEAFIFDLLYGNIDSKEDIFSRAKLWNWNLQRPHQVIVLELEDFDQNTSDSQVMAMLADITANELRKIDQTPILLTKKEEVVVIFANEKETRHDQKAYMETFVKKVLKAGEEMAPRTVRVGAGRIYKDPSEIFRSYQEAKVALVVGRIININGTTPSFRELGLTRILYNHDHQELLEFYKETLGELERYDGEQNSDLLNTMEKYLLYRCDLNTAADVLFLHPNTLRYRLKKIAEILDVDLNDFDTKLNLMVAFKIVYLLKKEERR
ncbi:MAG: hypothetical protein APF84_14625 [Gracilibacter sp. BRH_c7a]|nr:MAG: hypothetical protein APF84_14625 [Gracilibacter sp. BRH_c7a]